MEYATVSEAIYKLGASALRIKRWAHVCGNRRGRLHGATALGSAEDNPTHGPQRQDAGDVESRERAGGVVKIVPEQRIRQLHVKVIATGKTLQSIDVPESEAYWYRRIVSGLLINMDRVLYYVDCSEFDDIKDASKTLGEIFQRHENGELCE